jgi:8-oxo-dGTP pyrophosphatase MutT (NUDIX family)
MSKMNEKIFHVGLKAVIINQDEKILLLHRKNRNINRNKPAYWDLPGGRIKENEAINETLRREIKEETSIKNIGDVKHRGLILTDIDVPLKTGNPGGLVLSIYTCRLNEKVDVHLSAEHFGFEWVSPRTFVSRLKDRYPVDFLKRFKTLVA